MSEPLKKFSYAEIARLTRPPEKGLEEVASHDSHEKVASHLSSTESSKKAPNRRDAEQLNVRLPFELMEDARRWCFDNRISMKEFVEQAIRAKLSPVASHYSHDSVASHANLLATIDHDLDDDDQTIIQLYQKATGNTFNERDREVLHEYRHF